MSFDVLAPHYRWLEFVLAGEKLQRCRTAFLEDLPPARNILLLGEGPGRALNECRRRFGNARITCVDASARMLDQARRRLARKLPGAAAVDFVHADVLQWQPPASEYDLVMTHFFLDCFQPDQLEAVIHRMAPALGPAGHWLISDFQTASGGFQRQRSRLILWSMYVCFRAVTRLPAHRLTPPDPFLIAAGFRLQRRVQSEWGLLRSDWWQRGGPRVPN